MEDQHMTQQVFADFLQQSPATLSSIFNGRTRPTLNIVDAIKAKIPDISIEWLLYGTGDMYVSSSPLSDDETQRSTPLVQEPELNFGAAVPPVPPAPASVESTREVIKVVEKEPRHVIEIRVYYDDQTFETFVPSKKIL